MEVTSTGQKQAVDDHHVEQTRAGQVSPWWMWVGIVAVALVLGLGFLRLFGQFLTPLLLLILGITISAAITPIVEWLTQWMPRVVAVLLVYLVAILALALMLYIVVPPLVNQAQAFSENISTYRNRLNEWLQSWSSITTGDLVNRVTSYISSAASTLISLPLAIFDRVFQLILVIFISIYWTLLLPGIRQFFLSLFPASRRDEVSSVAGRMARAMGGYVRGSLINGVVVGLVTYIGMLVIGVPFPLVLGLIAGMLELIPNLGPIIALVPIAAIAALDSTTTALIAVAYMIVLQQVENHLLVPLIMRSQTEISPLLVVIALYAGASAAGILGAVTSIPIAGALTVFTVRVVAPLVRHWTGAESRG